MKPFLTLALVLLAATLSTGAYAAAVTITVQNIDKEGGDIRVVLYGSESTWLTHNGTNVLSDSAKPGEMTFTYSDIAPGTYAILAYHDANMNKDLDLNFLGIPTEQFGFSNNPGYNHTPKFSESIFQVGSDPVTMTIKLSH